MLKNFIYLLPALAIIALMSSCEDVIEVDSGFEEPQIVIDAWINNQPEEQVITLTRTQDYFDASLPAGISDALVSVSVEGAIYPFQHTEDGRYVLPGDLGPIGAVGDTFTLTVEADGQTYTSTTTMHRVPEIDSISITFEEANGPFEEGIYGQAYARDFVGVGDAYWMRAYKNDTLLNRPSEINLIWDATFDPGSGLDGVDFITPIRLGIMPSDDDGATITYQPGDEIYVELWSISPAAFRFMQLAIEQATNGDNGIFALPLANAQGNIVNAETQEPAIGVFNVAAVSTASKTVE